MAKNQSRLPDRSEFYYSLGIAYAASGKSENAIECYDEAVRNKPRYSEAYHNRGKVYHDIGQNRRAIEDYGLAI